MNIYKKKIKKQKQRLYIAVSLSLFILSFAVSVIFAIVTYNTEKHLLYSSAYSDYSDTLLLLQDSFKDDNYYAEYYVNKRYSGDEQVIVINQNGETVVETKNALPVDFSSYPYHLEKGLGCIVFENFKHSMTDEQYKKITSYLSQDKTDDGKYYELLCIDYYFSKGDIIPKSVEIVETTEENVWYVQDKVVERFELNPFVRDGLTLYRNSDMQRNVIDKEFVFGNYRRENLLSHVLTLKTNSTEADKTYYYSFNIDDIDSGKNAYIKIETFDSSNFGYGGILYDDNAFSSIYCNTSSFSLKTENNEENIYTVYYAKRFNVLDNCYERIVFILIYIFAIFVIVGIILAAIIWHTIKKQIEQEEKLRLTTNAMAHELKTPLFIIGGYAENLVENINTKKQSHYASVISEKSSAVNGLVEQMLDYSRIDSGYDTLNIEKINLNALTNDVVKSYEDSSISLEYGKEVYINADKRMIKSAIENLVDNAVKYTNDKNDIKIKITDKRFSVSNPSDEMSKSEINNLWQPYHRQARHSATPGHGLGLAIVKSIFKLHKFKNGAAYSNGRITFWFEY
ncbi:MULTISPECIES: cell wall metabolism sensor histidine kinase WalK [unclassified Ruminococcus]|uniref:sensor histidine kinase n=1 Tax=unclassified Ruminococcus TaxID=2608920 RepID=UPI002109DA60|nr:MULTISPECIES: HAMP domain-containing sensor histidine kinase [unclassified Ruminococcus]MCQ4021668.1 hypothetical protein [Ruminococcus sp. zg-924]MCQ4114113.1 hypothetical protein [Ruminococcus sp. zg-921]